MTAKTLSSKRSVFWTLLLSFLFSTALRAECFQLRLENLGDAKVPDTLQCRHASKALLCGCFAKEDQARVQMKQLRQRFSRLDPAPRIHIVKSDKTLPAAPRDEELRLMFQTFTYKSDLEHAYKVAKLALKRHPDSLYWHRQAAQVCQWTGRDAEAMRHWLYLYRHRPSPKLRDKIINHSLGSYQYTTAAPLVKERMFQDPSSANIRTFVATWEQAGRPVEAAKLLERLYAKSHRSEALIHALRLYLDTGEIDDARRIVDELQKARIDTPQSLELQARYRYIRRDIPASFRLLEQAAHKQATPPDALLRSLSDLGWYLGKRRAAANASRTLIRRGRAEQRDFQRVMLAFGRERIALEAAKEAWRRYGKKSDFFSFAYLALENKKARALLREIRRIRHTPESRKIFERDPLFYLVEAQARQILGKNDAAIASYHRALRLDPGNPEILSALLWAYQDTHRSQALQRLLSRLERQNPTPSLWLPMASAYLSLQRIDRADHYLRRLLQRHPGNLDLHLLAAYIAQARNEDERAHSQMRYVFTRLEAKKKSDPRVVDNPAFWERYLQSALSCVGADRYAAILRASRPHLDARRYRNYELSWALHLDADAWARRIRRSLQDPEPWALLSLALRDDDHDTMRHLLYRYYRELPLRDRVLAAQRTGQLGLAYTLAFQGLEQNREDELLYDQLRQAALKQANQVTAKSGILRRGKDLDQIYLNLELDRNLPGPYRLKLSTDLRNNQKRGGSALSDLPGNDQTLSLELRRLFDRGSLGFGLGYRHAMEGFATAQANLDWKLQSRWDLHLESYWHAQADETSTLLIGGYKDGLFGRLSYRLLPSTTLSAGLRGDRFSGQDGTELGSGYRWLFRATRQFRNGYPDLYAELYAEGGRYREKNGDHGAIDSLLETPGRILPDDDTYLGFGLGYGAQNASGYTRVWRPFAQFSTYYSLETRNPSFSLGGGFGGECFGQDHLVLGFDYSQTVLGTDEPSFDLYLRYNLLY